MKKYYVLPKEIITEEITSESISDVLPDFATNMDSDMNTYFRASETIIQNERQNDLGNTLFSPLVINPSLFNVYIRKSDFSKELKDGTCDWVLGLELKSNSSNYMILDRIHGTREEAVKRLEEIIVNGK